MKKPNWVVWIDNVKADKDRVRIIGPNKEANAKLITAAPELLEAAKAVLEEFSPDNEKWTCREYSETKKDNGQNCRECVSGRLIELLEPAVRKAVGK